MRIALAVMLLVGAASFAEAQESTQQFPPYRSPNQKQADYARSQVRQRYVAPTYTFPQRRYYSRGYWDYHPYGAPYGYYERIYVPRYPVYYPPVVRPWPVTPYPFRLP